MNILFVINDISYADHIAVGYLSAVAKKRGHDRFLCILDRENIVDKMRDIKPEVVAYSVNIVNFEKIVEAHKSIKDEYDFYSIMGGPHVTYSPETFPKSGMDAYCIGEGELPFNDFLEKVENNESFDDIGNLITKNKTNSVRPLIKDLADVASPDRDLTISNSFLKDIPKKTFYATRGCPFTCAYCCMNAYNKLYQGLGPVVRRFSVESVIQEIEAVKEKYCMEFVKFGDDIFVLKADEWLEEFAEKYSKRIGIPFNCFLRFDIVNEDVLKLLKKAGCYSTHLSVDSTSQHVRDNILKRRMRKVNIPEKLKMINSYGINTWVNYILSVPESTVQDDLDTIECSKKGKVTYPSYSVAVPMKGTDFYKYCLEKNIIKDNHVGDMSGCYQRSTLPIFTEKEKDIRYNVFLLGALASKSPFPINKFVVWCIKHIPPNSLFEWLRRFYYEYSITHNIFKIRTDGYEKVDTAISKPSNREKKKWAKQKLKREKSIRE